MKNNIPKSHFFFMIGSYIMKNLDFQFLAHKYSKIQLILYFSPDLHFLSENKTFDTHIAIVCKNFIAAAYALK